MVALAVATGTTYADDRWLQWFRENLTSRVELEGYRYFGYHLTEYSGDGEAFEVQNYSGFGGKRFTDIGQIRLTGRKVLGALNFDATIVDSRFTDPNSQRLSVDYARGAWAVNAGDINGNLLNTNRYANLSRSLKGLQLAYSSRGFRAKMVRSQSKGSARTVTFNGNNSPGPYYLQASQVLTDSEIVQVDGVTQVRGVDYLMSYEAGAITFVGKNIGLSSTVSVTFEALGINSRLGNLDGAAVAYQIPKAGQIGITAIRQKAPGSATGSTRLEKFFGFGPPSTPYALQFEPLRTEPITIRVNGQIQAEGVDYIFDTLQPAIFYFTRFMPPTAEIDVIYTPKPTGTVDGDREVLGFDYRQTFGEKGSLVVQQAVGKLFSPTNPSSGIARGLDLRWELGESPSKRDPDNLNFVPKTLSLDFGVRDIQPGYVSVDSRSFNRNEKAVDTSLAYRPNSKTTTTIRHSNSLVTTRVISNTGATTFVPSRVTNLGGSYLLNSGSNGTLTFDVNRRRTFTNGNASNLDEFAVRQNRDFSKGSLRYGLVSQIGRAPRTNSSATASDGFRILGLEASTSLMALNRTKRNTIQIENETITTETSETLRLNSRFQVNRSTFGGKTATGHLAELTLDYLRDRQSMNLLISDSASGALSGLGGFSGGNGIGLDGSGFSSGSIDNIGLGITSGQLIRFSTSYKVSDRLNWIADAQVFKSKGGFSSNSETRSVGVGLNYESGNHRINLRADTSGTQFVNSPIKSSATTLGATVQGGIGPRLTYELRGSYLVTGGSSTFQQNGSTLEGLIAYRIADRQTLSLDWAVSTITGYSAQDDLGSSVTYSYQIWQSLAFTASYRFRDVKNRESGLQTGAYRFGSLDFGLSFNFGR